MASMITSIVLSIGANFLYDSGKNIVKLLPHQNKNLINWLNSWNPSQKDLEIIKTNENIQRIVSILFEKVQNEVFEEKLSTWGIITDSILRNIKHNYSYELYFIKLFSDMPIPVISYLVEFLKTKEVDVIGVYPESEELQEKYFCENYCNCLSLIECFSGKFRLTSLGIHFLNFIGDKYQSNIIN